MEAENVLRLPFVPGPLAAAFDSKALLKLELFSEERKPEGLLNWFVMTIDRAELGAGEVVKGMAFRLWALPVYLASCCSEAKFIMYG